MAKNKKQSASSSSSSDENEARLQQLRDSVVTFESLKSSTAEAKAQAGELKSKRNAYHESECNHNLEDDSDDLNNFKLTPEFQQFVAKKLTKKLDE